MIFADFENSRGAVCVCDIREKKPVIFFDFEYTTDVVDASSIGRARLGAGSGFGLHRALDFLGACRDY